MVDSVLWGRRVDKNSRFMRKYPLDLLPGNLTEATKIIGRVT